MPRTIRVDALQCDLLHLTDRTTFIKSDFALVNLADDKWCCSYAGMCIGQDYFAPIGDGLRPIYT